VTDQNDIENDQESTALNLIGGRLHQVRESLGLSRAEVASQLHLAERLVKALEAGDEEHLPPMSYIIGYLRSYARLLHLPADELLAELHTDQEGLNPIIATSSAKVEASSRDLSVRLVTYLIVAGLVVLLAVWWYNQRVEKPEEPDSAVVETIKPGQSGELVLPPTVSEVVDEGTDSQPGAVSAQEEVIAEQPEQSEEAPVGDESMVAESPASEPTRIEPIIEEQQVNVVPDDAEFQELRLVFEQESWVEVEDATGKQVIFGLFSAGRVVDVRGVAPFEILLGYAPGVELYYNGSLFNHRPYQRQDVARFTLGQSDQEWP
jgi:cytoskeleton protein RodZ